MEGDIVWIVEIKLPLKIFGSEEFFLTGWVYDTSVENVTSHFPWIRSLHPETEFAPEKLTRNEWKEDFEALYYIVKYNYPYLWVNERQYRYNWLDLEDYYMKRLNEIETNEEFLDLTREAVRALQNGHTQIVTYESLKKYREIMTGKALWSEILNENIIEANKYWEELWRYSCPEVLFSYIGGEYVAVDGIGDWEEKYQIKKGAKVLKINGKNVDEAINLVKKKTQVWYDCDRDKLFMEYLNPTVFGENTTFTIKRVNGTIVTRTIECVSEDPYKEYFKSNAPNLEFKKWEHKRVAYIRIRSFSLEKMEEDKSKLLEFYKSIEDYDVLIIDLRGNEGGNDIYWKENYTGKKTL